MDNDLVQIIQKELGTDDAKIVIDAVENYMLQSAIDMPTAPPLVDRGRTRGDWNISLGFDRTDVRPTNFLSYTVVNEMIKSGAIRFAVDMKRANMVSPFRNERTIKVHSPDDTLADVAHESLRWILPQAAFEFSWSSLVYGSAFMEQVWHTTDLYSLGLSESKGGQLYTIPKAPNLVPHETVRHIMRKKNGDFDGFSQVADDAFLLEATQHLTGEGDIRVDAASSLVIPYNGYSRNLWGESFLGPLYPLWFWYEIILRSAVQFAQMMGDPPRLGKAPSRKKIRLGSSSDMVNAVDYLLALSSNLPKTNSIVIPSDTDENGQAEWEIGYMQLPDRTQPFVQMIEMFGTLILRAAMTGDTAHTVAGFTQAGSNAQSMQHSAATALHDEMIVTSWLTYLNKHWISKFSLYNEGVNGPPVWLELQGLDHREREFLASIMGIAGNSQTFQEFFFRVDWESLGRLSGLPMLSEEQAGQLKEKLSQESLDNQEAQLKMAKKFETPNAPSQDNRPNITKAKDAVQKTQELVEAKNKPIFLTKQELKGFLEEDTTKLYPVKHPTDKNKVAIVAALSGGLWQKQ